MSCYDRNTTMNLLTLRKSLYLDALKQSIPKPKGHKPNSCLPKWTYLPLETKIPMIPCIQENICLLSRRKLGESLRINFVDKTQFDTSDPYNYDLNLPYDGLHDKHLTRFFQESKPIQEMMIKTGIITPQLDVKCTLKEYNAYRNYLRILHGKSVKKELGRLDNMYKERMMLEISEKQAFKSSQRLKKEEKRAILMKDLKTQEDVRLKNIVLKQKRDDERVEALYEMKNQLNQRKQMECKVQRELFKHKLSGLAKIDQQKVLNGLQIIHERNRRFEKTMKQQLIKKTNEKMLKSRNMFEAKKEIQLKAIQNEKKFKKCAEEIKQTFIKQYEAKIRRSRNKLHELFLEKKAAFEKARRTKKEIATPTNCHCLLD